MALNLEYFCIAFLMGGFNLAVFFLSEIGVF